MYPRLFIAILFVVFSMVSSTSHEFFVSTTGTNITSNDCTKSSEPCTLSQGIIESQKVSSTDTFDLVFNEGIYVVTNESLPYSSIGMTFKAISLDKIVILKDDGKLKDPLFIFEKTQSMVVTFSGLSFENLASPIFGTNQLGNPSISFTNCRFYELSYSSTDLPLFDLSQASGNVKLELQESEMSFSTFASLVEYSSDSLLDVSFTLNLKTTTILNNTFDGDVFHLENLKNYDISFEGSTIENNEIKSKNRFINILEEIENCDRDGETRSIRLFNNLLVHNNIFTSNFLSILSDYPNVTCGTINFIFLDSSTFSENSISDNLIDLEYLETAMYQVVIGNSNIISTTGKGYILSIESISCLISSDYCFVNIRNDNQVLYNVLSVPTDSNDVSQVREGLEDEEVMGGLFRVSQEQGQEGILHGNITVEDSSYRYNSMYGGNGGVFHVHNFMVYFTNVFFGSNSVTNGNGGAVYILFDENSCSNPRVVMESTIYEDNSAFNGDGGGLWVQGIKTLDVSKGEIRFDSNYATGSGGGIFALFGDFDCLLYTNQFSMINNTAFDGYGGGIFTSMKQGMMQWDGPLSTLSDNSAGTAGGGLYCNYWSGQACKLPPDGSMARNKAKNGNNALTYPKTFSTEFGASGMCTIGDKSDEYECEISNIFFYDEFGTKLSTNPYHEISVSVSFFSGTVNGTGTTLNLMNSISFTVQECSVCQNSGNQQGIVSFIGVQGVHELTVEFPGHHDDNDDDDEHGTHSNNNNKDLFIGLGKVDLVFYSSVVSLLLLLSFYSSF